MNKPLLKGLATAGGLLATSIGLLAGHWRYKEDYRSSKIKDRLFKSMIENIKERISTLNPRQQIGMSSVAREFEEILRRYISEHSSQAPHLEPFLTRIQSVRSSPKLEPNERKQKLLGIIDDLQEPIS